jgi:hypothetical protein
LIDGLPAALRRGASFGDGSIEMKKALFVSLLALAACSAQSDSSTDDGARGPLGKADRIGECMPEDCGGPASEGTCWCDAECVDFGDCCSNKIDTCGAEACDPAACGPAPLFLQLCEDGSTAGVGDCVVMEDGQCGWEMTECPEPEPGEGPCGWQECGPVPLTICNGVISHDASCVRDDAGFCGWVLDECEEPVECMPADCGPQPEIGKLCPDGSVLGADLCIEVEPGNCGWTFPECPDPDPEPCCDPEAEPPGGIEGVHCCADGVWRHDIGNGQGCPPDIGPGQVCGA